MTEATLLFHRGKRPRLANAGRGFDNLKSFTAIIYVTVSNDQKPTFLSGAENEQKRAVALVM